MLHLFLHLARVYMISRYSIQSISRASVIRCACSLKPQTTWMRGLDAKAQCHGGFHKQSCHQVIHFHFPHCQFHQISNVLSVQNAGKSVLGARYKQHQSCKHLPRDQIFRDGKPRHPGAMQFPIFAGPFPASHNPSTTQYNPAPLERA